MFLVVSDVHFGFEHPYIFAWQKIGRQERNLLAPVILCHFVLNLGGLGNKFNLQDMTQPF